MRIDEEQLFQLNKQYLNLMDRLRKFNSDIHLFEERANDLAKHKDILQEKLNDAQRMDDEDAIEKANKNLDEINSQLDQLKTMVVIFNDKMKDNQDKVNRVIEKIKKKPGTRRYVREEMAKGYIKQIKNAEEQKRKAQSDKNSIIQMKHVIIKQVTPTNTLDEKHMTSRNKKSNVNLDKMIKRRIEALNSDIKVCDKKISYNYTALDNLKNEKVQEIEELKPEKKINKFKLLINNLKNFVKIALSRNKVKLLPAGSNLTDDDIKKLMQEVNAELADDDRV